MMTTFDGRPEVHEYPEAFQRYVARVPQNDILPELEKQPAELADLLRAVNASKETYRYAEAKWSIREVIGHVIDTERIFGYRALCIARGETTSLPGFDENEYAARSTVHAAPLADLVSEFEYLRRSHVLMFRNLSEEARKKMGKANNNPISVRALAWTMVGHVRHHMNVLQERYLSGGHA